MEHVPMLPDRKQELAEEERLEVLAAEALVLRRTLYALLELLAWTALAAPLAAFIVLAPLPGGFVWPRVFDFLHALLSGAVALVALRLSRRLLKPSLQTSPLHYAVALAISTSLGIGVELVQLVTPGDASAADLMRDIAGGVAGLAFALSRERSRLRHPLAPRGLQLVAIGLLCCAGYPVAQIVWQVRERKQAFPMLADFESSGEAPFVYAGNGATLERIPVPPGFTRAQGQRVGQVTFLQGESPKLELSGLFGDWSRAQDLAFEVFSTATSSVRLSVRIDGETPDGERDPFNTALAIPRGESTQRIPIDAIRSGLKDQTELARIRTLLFFMWEPTETAVLDFDAIRLEFASGNGDSGQIRPQSQSRHR